MNSISAFLVFTLVVINSIAGAILNPDPPRAPHEEAPWFADSGAQWIWPAAVGDGQNQYLQVLDSFDAPDKPTTGPLLAISADTNYAVYVNGQFVDSGQWSDYPDDKTYDVLNLAPHVRAGKNHLAVSVWYQGLSSSMYRKGPPGVVYAVLADGEIVARTGEGSQVRHAPDYVSGPVPRVSGQLSFTFEHRAQHDDGWRTPGYEAGSGWHTITASEQMPLSDRPVRVRPVAKLTLEERLPMRIAGQGVLVRKDNNASAGIAMQGDLLSARRAGDLFHGPRPTLRDADTTGLQLKLETMKGFDGAYIVLDAAAEEAGLLDIELDAPEGTVIDIGYGEHLEDLRVRTSIGGRSFGSRYVCKGGPQQFMHPFLRLAGRYVQMHILPTANSQPIFLKYAGMRPTNFAVPRLGVYDSPNSLQKRIFDVSRRTLELCMHEHYEDCPWREQALYAMDSRNQALTGYYTFGNYEFAKASISLLGKGMNPQDGWLELCAPAEIPITIPSFSLAWILMLDDYLLYSGDREFVESQLSVVKQILETSERDTTGPVIATPRGPRNWNFYEWAPGLDGGEGRIQIERYDAPLNLFYLMALDATARMMRETGQADDQVAAKANALREAFAGTFWDGAEQAFRTRVGKDQSPHFAELTQALAVLAGVVPEGERGALLERLARDNNGLVPCTISHTLYKFEALLTDGERYAPRVFDLIERDWGYMLSQGATSFWETIDGAAAFGDAGSLCHGWSGIPAYFYMRYLLGVYPTSSGFETYEMKPVYNVVPSASGKVPTPSGMLEARWSKVGMDVDRHLELVPIPGDPQ